MTALRINWVSLAVHLERLMLRRRHDVADRDGGGVAGEIVAALRAANAFDQAGPAEAKQNLLDVIGRQPLGIGQLAGSTGSAAVRPRRASEAR
jgi:hypothetical protein